MRFSTKLGLLFTICMIPAAVLGAREYQRVSQTSANLDRAVELSEFAGKIGNLVHEVQKERFLSASYLGTDGITFADELPSQHVRTDRRVVQLDDFTANFSFGRQERLLAVHAAAREALSAAIDQRQRVLALTTSAEAAAERYSRNNKLMLRTIKSIAAMTPDRDTSRQIDAYLTFLRGKERVGLERTESANLFALDQAAQRLLYDTRLRKANANQQTHATMVVVTLLLGVILGLAGLTASSLRASHRYVVADLRRQFADAKAADEARSMDEPVWQRLNAENSEGSEQVDALEHFEGPESAVTSSAGSDVAESIFKQIERISTVLNAMDVDAVLTDEATHTRKRSLVPKSVDESAQPLVELAHTVEG